MPHLTGNTLVRNPDDQRLVTLTAGQELPGWAVGMVGDHLLTDSPAGDTDTADVTGGQHPAAPVDPGAGPSPAATPSEPPRAGRGSGLDAWTAYAAVLGIEVPDGSGRDDIVDLVDQHASN